MAESRLQACCLKKQCHEKDKDYRERNGEDLSCLKKANLKDALSVLFSGIIGVRKC